MSGGYVDTASRGPPDPREVEVVPGALRRRSLRRARIRLEELALTTTVVVMVLYPLRGAVHFRMGHPFLFQELLVLGVAGVALDGATILCARNRAREDRRVFDWALVYVVLRSALLAAVPVRTFTLLGFGPPSLTVAYAFILLFPLFVPFDLRRSVAAASVAAALQPFVAYAVAAHTPTPGALAGMCGIASIVILLLWVCSRVATSLGIVGKDVGAYQIERLIRREPHGEVWLARHHSLKRPAVLRTMRAPRSHRGRYLEQLFERHARAAASLRSPHSATVYDYGSADGGFYSVTEFMVDGEPLEQLIARRGPLPASLALGLAIQVADSLADAHSRGIFHHGVVPASVVVAKVGSERHFAKLVRYDVSNMEYSLRGIGPDDETSDALAGCRDDAARDIYQLGTLIARLFGGRDDERARMPAVVSRIVERCRTPEGPGAFSEMSEVLSALEAARAELDGAAPETATILGRLAISRGAGRPQAKGAGAKVGTVSSLVSRAGEPPTFQHDEDETAAEPVAPHVSREVQESARFRLGQVVLVDAVASLVTAFLATQSTAVTFPESALHDIALLLAMTLTLDLCLLVASRASSLSNEATFRLGALYFVLRSMIMAVGMVRGHAVFGVEPPLMTFATLLVPLLPLFIPLSPRALFLPSALMAAAEPVASALFAPSNAAPVWPGSVVSAMAVFLWAQVLAHLLYGSRRMAAEQEDFGAYRRGELLGQGGVGQVWRAKHDLLERDAALKLIRPTFLRSSDRRRWLRRFKREANITAQLSSPHTVKLYDYGVNPAGVAYCVLELLEGEDLGAYVERVGPLSATETTALALQICDSLGEAHERGIVHRDLKPSNIFLVPREKRADVKVLDFGLASIEGPIDQTTTTSGHLMGTPLFMSPEALLGHEIDARSDIYQLGCVLYFAMTGEFVFERKNLAATALAHVAEVPPHLPVEPTDEISSSLDRIVQRCLRKQPDERFQSTDELVLALTSVGGPPMHWPSEGPGDFGAAQLLH